MDPKTIKHHLSRVLVIVPLVAALLPSVGRSQPAFPIYGISVDPNEEPTDSDLQLIANNYVAIQDSYLATDGRLSVMMTANPHFKPVYYLNSGAMTTTGRSKTLEENSPTSIAMVRSATLQSNITSTATSFTLDPLSDTNSLATDSPIPIMASTESGSHTTSSTDFVTWIEIDGEIMKITGWDASTNQITVKRGFDGTTEATHSTGAVVLTPVYIDEDGATPANNGFPGQSDIYYALDITTPMAVDWLVGTSPMNPSTVIPWREITDGYAGMWYDVCSQNIYSPIDMTGGVVNEPWNFSDGTDFTPDAYAAAQASRLAQVENAFTDSGYGITTPPFIIANSLGWEAYWPTDNDGDLKQSVLQQGVLNGYCMENFAGTTKNGVISYATFNNWSNNVQVLMDAAQSDLPAFPMIANAGADSESLETDGAERNNFEYWAWATYLIGVETDGGATAMGFPAYDVSDGSRFAWVNPVLEYPIGQPTESVPSNDLSQYLGSNQYTYVRTFSNGIVLVNPQDSTDDTETVNLGGTFYDPDNNYAAVTSYYMATKTGKILLNTDSP